jgi:hypothetical protein
MREETTEKRNKGFFFKIKTLHMWHFIYFKLKITHVASTCALNGSKLAWGAKIATKSKRRGSEKSCFF